MVERGGLENRCTFAGTVGSNPTPSATLRLRLRVAGHEVDWRAKALGRGSVRRSLGEGGRRHVRNRREAEMNERGTRADNPTPSAILLRQGLSGPTRRSVKMGSRNAG